MHAVYRKLCPISKASKKAARPRGVPVATGTHSTTLNSYRALVSAANSSDA